MFVWVLDTRKNMAWAIAWDSVLVDTFEVWVIPQAKNFQLQPIVHPVFCLRRYYAKFVMTLSQPSVWMFLNCLLTLFPGVHGTSALCRQLSFSVDV